MKIIVKMISVLLVIGFISCRDTKTEDTAANEAAIETIEAVEDEVEEISEQITEEANELEASLKELDSI